MTSPQRTILLVDDDLEILRLNHRMIREISQDYEVFASNTPYKALEIAKERQPDIIITDWYMPGMTGIEMIKALKADSHTKDIPIIMTTGVRISPDDLGIALEAGAIDYIRKPIVKVELHARVNSALLLSESYKEALHLKDAELNDSGILLAKNTEFLKGVQTHLENLKQSTTNITSTLDALNSEINVYLKSNSWERFETSFNNLHRDFNRKLLNQFPTITPRELKLAALLLLGMSTKNIASIFSISEGGIKVSRFRLRKKLRLSDKENLQTFLTSL